MWLWVAGLSWRLSLEAAERRAQIVEHGFKAAVQRGSTANYHIIMVRSHGYDIQPLHQFAKPAADAIAFRGGTDLFGHRKTDANRAVIVPRAALYNKSRAGHARSTGRGDEIRALP